MDTRHGKTTTGQARPPTVPPFVKTLNYHSTAHLDRDDVQILGAGVVRAIHDACNGASKSYAKLVTTRTTTTSLAHIVEWIIYNCCLSENESTARPPPGRGDVKYPIFAIQPFTPVSLMVGPRHHHFF